MAELQLEGLAAHRQAENLVAEADAEHRHVRRDQRLRVVDRVGQRRRIAGAVAQEHAVGIGRQQLGRRRASPDNTRTSQPCALSRRRMFHFMPKS